MKAVIFSKDIMTARKFGEQIKAIEPKDQSVTVFNKGGIIRFFEKNPADMVFLDIDDHEMDWQMICNMVKFADSKIWLVLLSASRFAAAKAFEFGASDYIVKPFGKDQIERTISKWKAAV